jgi:hypothetical protein
MTAKKLSDADVRRLTNLDELMGPRSVEEIPVVPSTPTPDSPGEARRSTNDPFEINFANVDIIEGLGKKSVKAPIRWFAWVFLAGPLLLAWPFFVYAILDGAFERVDTLKDLAMTVGALFLATAFCGFWPYILLRRK